MYRQCIEKFSLVFYSQSTLEDKAYIATQGKVCLYHYGCFYLIPPKLKAKKVKKQKQKPYDLCFRTDDINNWRFLADGLADMLWQNSDANQSKGEKQSKFICRTIISLTLTHCHSLKPFQHSFLDKMCSILAK